MSRLAPPTNSETRTLIDALLAEQRDLTAVERFARQCKSDTAGRSYRHLIPLSTLAVGEQYAFEVDLDKCSGCKSCVSACHSLNGLDEHETWRSVGLIVSPPRTPAVHQHITTACHHCVDPACLNGCPVLAYDKDPLTGIVRHLDDQCIGCQYCILMCPYEVPRYSEARGIVRKCDMCHQRLANGEAPACVQACPDEAIRITVVKQETVKARYRTEREASFQESDKNPFLPASPNPAVTVPTTRYISARPLPENVLAADAHEARVQHAHPPLVGMLILTQLGVGGFVLLPATPLRAQQVLSLISLIGLFAGLGVSVLHLGQPLKAWRAFLGLRRSWMSREIITFGLVAPLALASAAVCLFQINAPWKPWLLWATALAGLFGVGCSGMIYHVTQRECWRGGLSVGRFFATTLMLGLAAGWFATRFNGMTAIAFPAALVLISTFKLSRELSILHQCPDEADWYDEIPTTPLGRSAYVMRFRLGLLTRTRLACGVLGGVILPLAAFLFKPTWPWLACMGLVLCVAGELAERTLFFQAAVSIKMPGGVAA